MKCKNCKTDDNVFDISNIEIGCTKCNLTFKKHGGKRINAGRKSPYKEETQTISFRCPLSKVDELKLVIKSKLLEWSVK